MKAWSARRRLAAAMGLAVALGACATVEPELLDSGSDKGWSWEFLRYPPGTDGFVYGWREVWVTNSNDESACAKVVALDGTVWRTGTVPPHQRVKIAGRGGTPSDQDIQIQVESGWCES